VPSVQEINPVEHPPWAGAAAEEAVCAAALVVVGAAAFSVTVAGLPLVDEDGASPPQLTPTGQHPATLLITIHVVFASQQPPNEQST